MAKDFFTLEELAKFTNSKLVGDASHRITNVSDLESAGAEDASFLSNPIYEKAMRASKAGVVFITPEISFIKGRNFLICANPSAAFQQTLEVFLGDQLKDQTGFQGIHPTAVIHETALIGKDVSVGPHAVIDKNVVVGDSTKIGPGCYVGPYVKIGNDCCLYSNVTIRERCLVGNRVIIQPGAVIGSCGFGYIQDKQGRHVKLKQAGIVILEDDVEIGANTTIDRSRFKCTKVSRGSKIDNLVQLGHGVIVGEDNIIISQTGIAGSTKTGNHVILAGQVAVAGHLSIADKVMIAGKSGVSKSISESGKYGGIPVMPLAEYNRNSVYLRNIEKYINEIKELKKRLEALENSST